MTDLRKAAEAALEALDAICDDLIEGDSFGAEQIARRGGASVRTMLRAALAEPVQPIAWATLGEDGGVSVLFPTREEAANYCDDGEQPTPLYTAPPQPREPVRLDDAARYQWLRNSSHWPAVFDDSDAPEPLRGGELDAAIDAALRAQESDR